MQEQAEANRKTKKKREKSDNAVEKGGGEGFIGERHLTKRLRRTDTRIHREREREKVEIGERSESRYS